MIPNVHFVHKIIFCALFLSWVPAIRTIAQQKLPEINQDIVNYVGTMIGETVGRGECWDLADQALTHAGAYLDRSSQKTIYIFGKQYDPKKKTVLPGDIIQFENVTVKYQDGNIIYTENYGHHTAIIYEVNPDGSLKLAHQNTSFGGRKVILSDMKLENVRKGKMYFYRPFKS